MFLEVILSDFFVINNTSNNLNGLTRKCITHNIYIDIVTSNTILHFTINKNAYSNRSSLSKNKYLVPSSVTD